MLDPIKKDLYVKGVVHVGAHRGEELEDHVSIGAEQIVWIEANPDLFGELYSNLMVSSVGLPVQNHIFNVACSDVDNGTAEFHVVYGPDAGYGVGNKGCSSLLKPRGAMQSWEKGTISVKTMTLDTLIRDNDLDFKDFDMLELDVQGAELMVLRGATEFLKHVKYVYSEVTFHSPDYEGNPLFDDISEYLAEFGFVHTGTKFYDGVSNWADALFERVD